jgi:hypothetical protein
MHLTLRKIGPNVGGNKQPGVILTSHLCFLLLSLLFIKLSLSVESTTIVLCARDSFQSTNKIDCSN